MLSKLLETQLILHFVLHDTTLWETSTDPESTFPLLLPGIDVVIAIDFHLSNIHLHLLLFANIYQ